MFFFYFFKLSISIVGINSALQIPASSFFNVYVTDDGEHHGSDKVYEQILHRVARNTSGTAATPVRLLSRNPHPHERHINTVGLMATELNAEIHVSFCISVPQRRLSMLHSKNSHSTPIVMEKQNETTATKPATDSKRRFHAD